MSTQQKLQAILDATRIAPDVFSLRPDYRALLMIVHGLKAEPSNDVSESMLKSAEQFANESLAKGLVTELPHIAAWREAYKAFGAKPTKFRNSLEALTRRTEKGLPRVNRLTDVYNAISVKYQIPIGGEDLDKYSGPPHLKRSDGTEKFEVTADGKTTVEHPDAGEVVWCDDEGVTCRRWNWRQGPRTALTDDTTSTLFIMDVLEPISDEQLNAAADELAEALTRDSPDAVVVRKLLSGKT